jgi:tetratricopeptide (TPR) repeat protein
MVSSRQLAAIMFTDIVGFTALMGENETKAFELLEKNRRIQKPIIESYGGRWLKEMGDGVLASFSTITDAVYCAVSIQKQFRDQTDLQIRIGIHQGEVVFEEEDVFGDGVNIASRIESIAGPDSIWVSETVSRNIQNKQGIETKFIGERNLKNVKESVRVYEVEITGDIPEIQSSNDNRGSDSSKFKPNRYRKRIVSTLGVMVLLMLAYSLYTYFSYREVLPENLKQARIAVLPFQNNTNDPELDMLGDMAADWIVQGLIDLGDIKVVQFQTVKDNIQYASINGLNDLNDVFRDHTGAEKIIQGSIYLVGEDLFVQSQLIDLTTGELEMTLGEISGSKNDLKKLVTELSQRIQGFFVTDMGKSTVSPPTYKSYKYFREGLTNFGWNYQKTLESFSAAIISDSTYILPYIWLSVQYGNIGELSKRDSIVSLFENNRDHLNLFEELLYDWMTADPGIPRYQTFKKLFDIDPMEVAINYQMGLQSMVLNKPLECLEYYGKLDINNFKTEYSWMGWWHANYAYCWIRMKQPEKAIEVLGYVPEQHFSQRYYTVKLLNHAMFHVEDSVSMLIDQVEESNKPKSWIISLNIEAAMRYALIGNKKLSKEYATAAVEMVKDYPDSLKKDFADAYYYSGNYEAALPLYQLVQSNTGNKWITLSRIGSSYAKIGNIEAANGVINELLNLKHRMVQGRKYYGVARIYAALGDSERAMENVTKAFRYGKGVSFFSYDLDPDLKILHDHPDFQQFLNPAE